MQKISCIIPTRGKERKLLVENCLRQLQAQTVKPDEVILVDHPGKEIDGRPVIDLSERLIEGIAKAKHERIAIIEDDDYYPINYIEILKSVTAPCCGQDETIYYHIQKLAYHGMYHMGRSSLFTTSFLKEAVKDFEFPEGTPFVDIKLWQHFALRNIQRYFISPFECQPIGIKHNIGLCGGSGHSTLKYRHKDPTMHFLHSKTDNESFNFYRYELRNFRPGTNP